MLLYQKTRSRQDILISCRLVTETPCAVQHTEISCFTVPRQGMIIFSWMMEVGQGTWEQDGFSEAVIYNALTEVHCHLYIPVMVSGANV